MENWTFNPDKELGLKDGDIAQVLDWTPNYKFHNKGFTFCITRACNMQCKFCVWDTYKERDNVMVSLEFFKEVVLKMKDYNYNHCSLIGGEVCLCNDFDKMINFLVENEITFTFVTNAKVWEQYRFIFETPKIKKWFRGFAVSLDGNRETHDRYRGEGAYDNVIELLEYSKRNKLEPSIKMVLRSDNCQDLMHVFSIAEKYNLKFEAFDCHNSEEFVMKQPHKELIEDICEKNKKRMEKMLKKNKITVRHFFIDKDPLCFCPYLNNRKLSIQPDGEVCLCCGALDDRPIGNIKTDDVGTLLRTKGFLALHLTKKISPLLFNGIPFCVRDSCAMCRFFLDCPDRNTKKDSPSN